MLGGHLDGLFIKEADKVPRRSAVLIQPPTKRAKVEESGTACIQLSTTSATLPPKEDSNASVLQIGTVLQVPTSTVIHPPKSVPSAPPRNNPMSLIKREE